MSSKKADKPLYAGQARAKPVEKYPAPKSGTKVYILTSAQSNTRVHKPVWENLQAYAKYRKAKILCAKFTYNQNAYSEFWFDPLVKDIIEESSRDIEIAPSLIWCGRQDISPTASNPLSGFETYTGRKSGIFPHVKLALQSIPSGKYEATKMNYTTGTVTQLNYVPKKAGHKAERHHSYGALIVESTKDGWFARQLQADHKDRICDLDVIVENGKVRKANVVEAINWGDIHVSHLDPDFKKLAWAKGGIIDQLKPKFQYYNDILTFNSRNHWDLANDDLMFKKHIEDKGDVEQECKDVVDFLKYAERPWCAGKVVFSNHDYQLERWLRDTDYREDPINSIFYLKCKLASREAARDGVKNFYIVEHALRELGCPTDVHFMRADEDHIICKGQFHKDGINNVHGHLGVDGGKGSAASYTKLSRPINSGHTHKAGIYDDVFVAGVSTITDHGYNVGFGTWSNSMIITYMNGIRCIVTVWNNRYRGR